MSADPTPSVPEASVPSPTEPSSAPARRVTCFSIRAAAEPGIMPRVMEVFAKRSLVPQRWYADRLGGPDGDELSIDLQVADLSAETCSFLARCLRQIWGVEAVLTSEKGFA
jgi:hypothetical protein